VRGQFLHNLVLVQPLADLCCDLGAKVACESIVRSAEGIGYVDLLADWDTWRLVIEAELSARRAYQDRKKATVLKADYLLVVTPQRRIADAIERKLLALVEHGGPRICVLPLGPALQWVRNTCHLMSPPNVLTTFNHKIQIEHSKSL
jgi:hypothetical protein